MKNVFNILIFVLLCFIASLQTCSMLSEKKEGVSDIDTVYVKTKDTWHIMPTKETLVPYKVEVAGTPGATITIPAVVDTNAIIADYFTRRHYADSLKNDSITIFITESCYRNQIYDRKIMYKWTAPTMLIKETKQVEKQLLFLGADFTGNAGHFGFYPSVYFDTKRSMLGGGYDVINNFYKLGVYSKIKLWNKK